MQLSNTAWTLIATSPTLLEMQNVGEVRIAYAYGSALPQSDVPLDPNYIALETDAHFILNTGSEPYRYSGAALGTNVYGRALGPKAGRLALRKAP